MGVKTPPLSSRMRGPIFPPLPPVPFRGPANNLVAPLPCPSIPLLCAIPTAQRTPPFPVGAPLVGALPPILPLAARHPIPSPVIPRLREESHLPTLNSPPSQYCAPFPPLTALLFPHMAVPRGRPSPHPTHCRAPSYTFPNHSEAPRGTSPPHSQHPSNPFHYHIISVGAPLVGALLCLPLSFRGSARNLTCPRSTILHPFTY